MNPKVNYGPWVIVMCLLIITIVSLWWGILVVGETMYVYGLEAYGKSLNLPLTFAVNLKLLLKSNSNKKQQEKILRPRPSTRSIKFSSLESRTHTLIYQYF